MKSITVYIDYFLVSDYTADRIKFTNEFNNLNLYVDNFCTATIMLGGANYIMRCYRNSIDIYL